MARIGTNLSLPTAEHQSADGQAERMVQVVEQLLLSFANHQGTNWKRNLGMAELGN